MIRVGISGWTYPGWRGVFYPEDLPHRRELEFASRCFSTIEINGTFYALQSPSSYESWYQQTPDDFLFSIKANRYLTHQRRLKDVEKPLANFFASGVLSLREKLGPILWQLPPSFRYDAERLEQFISLLPQTTDAALRLARKRERWMSGRVSLRAQEGASLRHAFEVRHESFLDPSFFRLLRQHRMAWVIVDAPTDWPQVEELTTDWTYLRLHGHHTLYSGAYGIRRLSTWAKKIQTWEAGPRKKKRDVFVYFDNDAKVKAPEDARILRELLSRRRIQPDSHPPRSFACRTGPYADSSVET